jgi:hypothetical protein
MGALIRAGLATLINPGIKLVGGGGTKAKFTFNGTDQYAVMPSYSTLGDPAVYRKITYDTNNDDGNVIADAEPLGEFGRVGANYHSGNLFRLKITDSSPIQGVDAFVADGVRTLNLPQMLAQDKFVIECDMTRRGTGQTLQVFSGTQPTDGLESSITFTPTDIILSDILGNETTLVNALSGLAAGQHFHFYLEQYRDKDTDDLLLQATIDGVEGTPVASISSEYIWIDSIKLPALSLIRNFTFANNSGGYVWTYPLDDPL